MAQEQQNKNSSAEDESQEVEAKDLTNETLNEDIDNILDEIDEVLEENAEDFVRSYIQKGGQ